MTASGIPVPSNVTGWDPILLEDFNTDVPMGKFIDHPAYAKKITARRTGTATSGPWKTGIYDNGQVEVKNSSLITHVATVTDATYGTKPRTSAFLPILPPNTAYPWGVKEGRFSVCFRVPQALPGYKVAWLLWPDKPHTWPEYGEIDFPEQNLILDDKVKGFMHNQGATTGSDQVRALGPASLCDNKWHVATIRWRAGDTTSTRGPVCRFDWDGVTIGRYVDRVPFAPMHWVLQTEPYLGTWAKPDPAVKGVIEIDWIAAHKAV